MEILKNLFGKLARQNQDEPQGIFANKKMVNIIVWIGLGVILLISMGSCGNDRDIPLLGGENGRNGDFGFSAAESRFGGIDIAEYRQNLERDISEALSRMEGAGEVSVTISFKNSGERILAADRQANEERNREGDSDTGRNIHRITREDRIVLHGRQNQGTTPIVISETTPRISGALVVAQGAGDDRIRLKLHQAARAVLGAPAHRIKIVEGKNY